MAPVSEPTPLEPVRFVDSYFGSKQRHATEEALNAPSAYKAFSRFQPGNYVIIRML